MKLAVVSTPKKGYANNLNEDSVKNLNIALVMIGLFVFVIIIGKIIIQHRSKMIFKRNLQDL